MYQLENEHDEKKAVKGKKGKKRMSAIDKCRKMHSVKH